MSHGLTHTYTSVRVREWSMMSGDSWDEWSIWYVVKRKVCFAFKKNLNRFPRNTRKWYSMYVVVMNNTVMHGQSWDVRRRSATQTTRGSNPELKLRTLINYCSLWPLPFFRMWVKPLFSIYCKFYGFVGYFDKYLNNFLCNIDAK